MIVRCDSCDVLYEPKIPAPANEPVLPTTIHTGEPTVVALAALLELLDNTALLQVQATVTRLLAVRLLARR